MSMRSWSRAVLAGMSVVAVAAMAGCSASGQHPEPVTQKDMSRWVMPLDGYREISLDPVGREAWLVGTTQCMREAGFDAPDVPVGYAPPKDRVFNHVGYRLSSPEVMGEFGYHLEEHVRPLDLEDPGTIMSDRLQAWGDAGAVAYEQCSTEYEHFLQTSSDSNNPQSANLLALEAEYIVAQSGELAAYEKKWHECMKPLGIASLPMNPTDFPSTELYEAWGFPAGDTPPGHTFPITADELRLARHDAQCLIDSGYHQAKYDREWAEQEKLLEANKASLDADYAKARAVLDEAREFLDNAR